MHVELVPPLPMRRAARRRDRQSLHRRSAKPRTAVRPLPKAAARSGVVPVQSGFRPSVVHVLRRLATNSAGRTPVLCHRLLLEPATPGPCRVDGSCPASRTLAHWRRTLRVDCVECSVEPADAVQCCSHRIAIALRWLPPTECGRVDLRSSADRPHRNAGRAGSGFDVGDNFLLVHANCLMCNIAYIKSNVAHVRISAISLMTRYEWA